LWAATEGSRRFEARTIGRGPRHWKFIPSPSGYLENRYSG
jgi:hypothetical protein